jgi:phosphoketolase
MGRTLEALKHRVNVPEPGTPEAIDGAIITALNEEAVIGAALANKAGISLSVSYEAFAMKMLGALRQEIIFARRQKEIGRPPRWLSVPLIATSHTWENAKNEQSHQDPTLPEALMGEMADTARVLFPIDANSAIACLRSVYSTHGQIACLVTPKRGTPFALSGEGAAEAVAAGAAHIAGSVEGAKLQFVAIGAYQLQEALKAHNRLAARGVTSCVTAMLEPARFRAARDDIERAYLAPDEDRTAFFPPATPRIVATHTRPEPMLGTLRPIDSGPSHMRAHGYLNRGGTLDVFGMLFANRTTWAHLVASAAWLLNMAPEALLTPEEADTVAGRGDPQVLRSAGAVQ